MDILEAGLVVFSAGRLLGAREVLVLLELLGGLIVLDAMLSLLLARELIAGLFTVLVVEGAVAVLGITFTSAGFAASIEEIRRETPLALGDFCAPSVGIPGCASLSEVVLVAAVPDLRTVTGGRVGGLLILVPRAGRAVDVDTGLAAEASGTRFAAGVVDVGRGAGIPAAGTGASVSAIAATQCAYKLKPIIQTSIGISYALQRRRQRGAAESGVFFKPAFRSELRRSISCRDRPCTGPRIVPRCGSATPSGTQAHTRTESTGRL